MENKIEGAISLLGHLVAWVSGTYVLLGDNFTFYTSHRENYIESIIERIMLGLKPDDISGYEHILIFELYPLVDILTSVVLILSIVVMILWSYKDIKEILFGKSDKEKKK